ncbi:MAG: hypothetical protein PHE88_03515 [Elusimicrobia bacterium]|nr:hypothetical protein [Elusimicrobiota bacterium]
MKLNVRVSLGFCAVVAMLITACATTSITSVWKNKSYQLQAHKIMIIGILKSSADRRILEDEFVKQLNVHGTAAIASYSVIPDDKQGDDKLIESKMTELGADAVIITRLVNKKAVYTYAPNCEYYPPVYYSTWRDYYLYGCQDMYSPGYMSETDYAIIETNMYDAGKSNLIWSTSSKTEILGSDKKFILSYIEVIVKTMAKHKLLGLMK